VVRQRTGLVSPIPVVDSSEPLLNLNSYYLAKVLATVGITDRRKQNQINLGLTCWNLVTGVTGAFLTKTLNRRT
jgi:hypothetical protein